MSTFRNTRWSTEELKTLCDFYAQDGGEDLSALEKKLPGRTAKACQMKFFTEYLKFSTRKAKEIYPKVDFAELQNKVRIYNEQAIARQKIDPSQFSN